jgi:hypothetical protein
LGPGVRHAEELAVPRETPEAAVARRDEQEFPLAPRKTVVVGAGFAV